MICTSCGVLVGVGDERCYNCGRRNPGLWGYAKALRALGADLGFVPFIIGTCIILFALTLLFSRGQVGMGGLFSLLSPSTTALFLFGSRGAVPVFALGRWWTVLSAAWLHGGALHILFNMMWVRQLAPSTADLYGPGRTVIIYTAASIAGFTLSSVAGAYMPNVPFLRGSQFTVGASAPIFGLLGALVYYGRRGGSTHIGSQALSYALMLGIFGFIMPGIDGGGYLAARLLDPLKPERTDHLAIAVVCLALSLLSIVWSFIDGLPVLSL